MQARKNPDAIAFAVRQALADTRKGKASALSFASGQITLVSGHAQVTGNPGVKLNSFLDFMLVTPNGTLGTNKKVVLTTDGQFDVYSVDTTGSTQTADTSILKWRSMTPYFHGDKTTQYMNGDYMNPVATLLTVTAAAAVDLPTSLVLANQMKAVLNIHMAEGDEVHVTADTWNAISTADATDETSAETLANAIKTAFNAHLTQAGVHVWDDSLNSVSTANASNPSTLWALLNALKAAVNLHLASAAAGESVGVTPE